MVFKARKFASKLSLSLVSHSKSNFVTTRPGNYIIKKGSGIESLHLYHHLMFNLPIKFLKINAEVKVQVRIHKRNPSHDIVSSVQVQSDPKIGHKQKHKEKSKLLILSQLTHKRK